MKKMTVADSNDITKHPHDDSTRPYLCTVAGKRFKMKSRLDIHTRNLDGENVWYACTYCEKGFPKQSNLRSHMNVHSGKYKCTECGKCCQHSVALEVHRRIHSGEKPF